MSKCCSPKEREEIINIIEGFIALGLNVPPFKFRTRNNTVETKTVGELLDAVVNNTECGELFLHALREVAYFKKTDIVSIAREVFDPARFRNDCCGGDGCNCGGNKSGCGGGCSH